MALPEWNIQSVDCAYPLLNLMAIGITVCQILLHATLSSVDGLIKQPLARRPVDRFARRPVDRFARR